MVSQIQSNVNDITTKKTTIITLHPRDKTKTQCSMVYIQSSTIIVVVGFGRHYDQDLCRVGLLLWQR